MSQFPVTSSILSADRIAEFLIHTYDLSDKTTCRILKSGISDTYLVEEQTGKFVFRVYSLNWRTSEEIHEELKLLSLLKENSVSVSYPIADSQKNYIQRLNAPEGERFAVLFSYAEGKKEHIVSAETHFKIGQLIARFHLFSSGQKLNRVTYTPEMLLIDPLKRIADFLDSETEEFRFMLSAQKKLLQIFENTEIAQIRTGIVHMDIWFDNLNIADSGDVTLFDFDFCGNGWLCMDLAYYMLQLHNIEKYEKSDYQPKIDRFLEGYESILPVSTEEKRLIPALGVSLYFFYLGVQCQRYDDWSNSFLNESYLKRFITGLVKRYFDIYELDNEKPLSGSR